MSGPAPAAAQAGLAAALGAVAGAVLAVFQRPLVWIAVVRGVVGAVHGLVLVRLVVPRGRPSLAVPPADRRRDR